MRGTGRTPDRRGQVNELDGRARVRRVRRSAGAAGAAEERLDQREAHVRSEAVPRASVLPGVADALDRRRVAEEIAHARDEHADAVFGIGALGPRAARGTQDLVGAQAFARAAKELQEKGLEGAETIERDL